MLKDFNEQLGGKTEEACGAVSCRDRIHFAGVSRKWVKAKARVTAKVWPICTGETRGSGFGVCGDG